MNNQQKILLSTLGPASLNANTIKKLDEVGVDIFRINLSHTPLDRIEPCIDIIRDATEKPICLDTEGAQIRNGNMMGGKVLLERNHIIKIHNDRITGDAKNLYLTPHGVNQSLMLGDIITIDFDTLTLKVVSVGSSYISALVLNEGVVGSNKAVSVNRSVALSPLSEKDLGAIKIAINRNIEYMALSFASSGQNVIHMRGLMEGADIKIISKIESLAGIENLKEIIDTSDSILIDRGDLSREVPFEKIPYFQKNIIRMANIIGKPAYVATNLLESMIEQKNPTRAEVNDVINTLIDGCGGLVLAAETAIGKYPVDCARMIMKMIKSYTDHNNNYSMNELLSVPSSLNNLYDPHGGKGLINRLHFEKTAVKNDRRQIVISEKLMGVIEEIATGVYSPLMGFMGQNELKSVLSAQKLLDQTPWATPLLFPVLSNQIKAVQEGDVIELLWKDSNIILAEIEVGSIFQFSAKVIAEKSGLPGEIDENADTFISGKINLKCFSENLPREFLLTPADIRNICEHNGWSKILVVNEDYVQNINDRRLREIFQSNKFDHVACYKLIETGNSISLSEQIIHKLSFETGKTKEPPLTIYIQKQSGFKKEKELIRQQLVLKNYGFTHMLHEGVESETLDSVELTDLK